MRCRQNSAKAISTLDNKGDNFATRVRVIEGSEHGRLEAGALRHIGPDLVFGRLWKKLGLDPALNRLLKDRGFEFPVERAVSLTVLHRLFESGSDRAGER